MLKYVDVMETFAEVPDEITLAINLSNCPHRCKGCHSEYLQKDIGEELTTQKLQELIEKHKGISCVAFLGGDNDPKSLLKLAKFIKSKFNLKTCWYSGSDYLIADDLKLITSLDYVKFGSYQEERGPLTNPNTNQTFWKKEDNRWDDITYKFWK
jgi:anaerobic ribonucleoside-triphosphate reductase activating protein